MKVKDSYYNELLVIELGLTDAKSVAQFVVNNRFCKNKISDKEMSDIINTAINFIRRIDYINYPETDLQEYITFMQDGITVEDNKNFYKK